MEFWTIIGTAAAVCGAISLIPEVAKAYKTHHLQDVSWGMLFLLMSSSLLWGSYGLHIQDLPLVMSAGINLIMESALMAMKMHYDKTGKPLKNHLQKEKNLKNLYPADLFALDLTPSKEEIFDPEKNYQSDKNQV